MITLVKRKNLLSAEQRLIALFDEMGPNVKKYWGDVKENYGNAIKSEDNFQKAMGVVGGAASVVLEGTDVLWSGMADEPYVRPKGIAGRIRRDTKALLGNLNPIDFHPIKAVGNGWRLLTSDIPMDTIDIVGGFHQDSGTATRSQVQALMGGKPLPKQYLN